MRSFASLEIRPSNDTLACARSHPRVRRSDGARSDERRPSGERSTLSSSPATDIQSMRAPSRAELPRTIRIFFLQNRNHAKKRTQRKQRRRAGPNPMPRCPAPTVGAALQRASGSDKAQKDQAISINRRWRKESSNQRNSRENGASGFSPLRPALYMCLYTSSNARTSSQSYDESSLRIQRLRSKHVSCANKESTGRYDNAGAPPGRLGHSV